jgi:dsRNA-specific ribonuclease
MAAVGAFPSYRVVVDSGVEGDDRRFTVEVSLAGEALAQATDRTKRAAQREAARAALARRSLRSQAGPSRAEPSEQTPPHEELES